MNTEEIKPFNGHILDEIISGFNNQIILGGSLCDYAHINYTGEIKDFDFIIDSSVFLRFFNITKFEDIINSQYFKLKLKANSFHEFKISYYGKYKDIYPVDFFIFNTSTDHSLSKLNDEYTSVSSSIFYEKSKYNEYLINSFNTRKRLLEELSEIVSKKDIEIVPLKWTMAQRQEWKLRKIKQINEKYPLYYEYQLKQSNTHVNCK